MGWRRVLLAVSLTASFAAVRDAAAFARLQYLEVGDELPAGSLDGDRIRFAASPDRAHVYVTGDQANSLLLFSTHRYSGNVTLEQTYVSGPAQPGLDEPNDVLVTADGRHLIVSQRGSSGVSVFTRSSADGTLVFLEQQRNGIAGVTGLSLPERLALDPTNRHLYVLTTDSVVVFERQSDGTLEFVEDETAGFTDAFFDDVAPTLDVSSDGRHLYAVSPDDGHVVVYARDGITGALSLVETESAGGTLAPSAVAVAPDGRFVYVATSPDCDTGGIALFSRDAATGQLAYVSTKLIEYFCLPSPRIEFHRSTGEICFLRVGIAVAPEVALHCYQRDATTGELGAISPGTVGSAFDEWVSDFVLAEPFAYAVEPVSLLTSEPALSAFSYPVLRLVETQQDTFDGVEALDGPFASDVASDGRHVYVASRYDGAIQIFTRDRATGGLEAAGEVRNGTGGITSLNTPTDVAVSPDGKHVYATASTSDALTVFSRNATTGALTLVEVESDGLNGVTTFQAPSGVAVSRDGHFVLATSAGEHAVVSFTRDATTGALTFADSFTGFLDQASDVTVSSDVRHVYVTAEGDGTLTGLSIDATGMLTFFERLNDNLGAVDGLTGARNVVVSPDGKHIYVAGIADPRVAVFARNATNGSFTFVEALHATPGGASPGLGGGDGLAITPNGRFVFAGDIHSNTQDVVRLIYYRRDPSTGRLYYTGYDQSATEDIAVSPDGRQLYVAGFSGDRLTVFAPEPDAAAAALGALTALALIARAARRTRAPAATELPRSDTKPMRPIPA